MAVKTYGLNRKCKKCGKKLSMYNHKNKCFTCRGAFSTEKLTSEKFILGTDMRKFMNKVPNMEISYQDDYFEDSIGEGIIPPSL